MYLYFNLFFWVTDKPAQKRQSTHHNKKQCLCRLLVCPLFTWSHLATFHHSRSCQIYRTILRYGTTLKVGGCKAEGQSQMNEWR